VNCAESRHHFANQLYSIIFSIVQFELSRGGDLFVIVCLRSCHGALWTKSLAFVTKGSYIKSYRTCVTTLLSVSFPKKNSGNAEFEWRRREDRGAMGVGMGSPPTGEGVCIEGAVPPPPPEIFFDFGS